MANGGLNKAADQEYLSKKKNLMQLGEMAKTLGINQNLEEGEFHGIQFIKPNQKSKGYMGKSSDYIVIMHFDKNMRELIAHGLTDRNIEQQFHKF